MKITAQGNVNRASFYDRNPLIIGNTYRTVVAPAGTTTRWTYTVPTGRKAQLEWALASAIRFAVATTGHFYGTWVVYTPNAGNPMDITQIQDFQNLSDSQDRTQSVGLNSVMLAADQIKGQTTDTSTGGTVYFDNSTKTTEFDA